MRETELTRFADRADGGRQLAVALRQYKGASDAIVIGLPRGGVVTAAAIAEDLGVPLDVLVVRKLGTPGQSELAMGAIGPDGVRVLNEDIVRELGISPRTIDAEAERQKAEIDRRQRMFRGDRPPLDFANKTVIVVDDGLATGATMEAAIAVIRHHNPARIVMAIPVAPVDTLERLKKQVEEAVCLEAPDSFGAVGFWYVDFEQVEDDEVVEILERFRARAAA